MPEPLIENQSGGVRVTIFKKKEISFSGLNERQLKAIDFVKEKGNITNSDYQKLNNVSKATATRDLTELSEKYGVFKKVGLTGVGTVYVLMGS